MTAFAHRTHRRRQGGFSLIDIMVGLVIGLIAVLVIYQVFVAAEGIKRNTISAGDAQQNGLLSSFMMTVELANAANGLAANQQDLMTCAAAPDVASFASSWRPIPVLISDGGGTATAPLPDQFIVTYSTANSIVAAAPFTTSGGASTFYPSIQSPQGFHKDDLIVLISKNGSGDCVASRVSTPPVAGTLGRVDITHTGTPVAFTSASTLFNMGPSKNAQKARYDISGEVLRLTSLLNQNGGPDAGAVPNPIASNVVMMKLQYGIDTDGDGRFNTWVSPTGPWSDTQMLVANAATLNKIKAIRIAIVTRGEQFDKGLDAQDAAAPGRKWTIFDATISGLADHGFRYRVYEMVVPLRNPIFNS